MNSVKYWMCLVIIFSSCQHKSKNIESSDLNLPPPPPPPNITPPSPAPDFRPNILDLAEIQINPLPHPFNLDGHMPYAVWVNGKKLPLNSVETRSLAKALNLKFEQPKDTAEIHSGAGWQFPLFLKNGSKDTNNRKYEQKETFTQGL